MEQFTPADRPPQNSTRLVIVAAVLALLAVVLVNAYISVVRSQSAEESITRYRLTRTLNPGDRLNDRDIEPVQVPKRFGDAFTGYLSDQDVAVKYGQVVRHRAPKGQFLSFAGASGTDNGSVESHGETLEAYSVLQLGPDRWVDPTGTEAHRRARCRAR